jgi:hypothetical protein
MRHLPTDASAVLLGLLAGVLLWSLVIGVQIHRFQPGLWTLRTQRAVACGLDYNGPPFTTGERHLWLTCGDSERGWQLWPVR